MLSCYNNEQKMAPTGTVPTKSLAFSGSHRVGFDDIEFPTFRIPAFLPPRIAHCEYCGDSEKDLRIYEGRKVKR